MRVVDPRKPNELCLEPHSRGRLSVFEQPDTDDSYVVCADIAEGKAVEGIQEDKSKYDFSCAHVLRVTKEWPFIHQDAIWHGSCDPDEYGNVLVALAMLFNNALLSWEINGPGRSLKLQVLDILKYRNVYLRQETDTISHKQILKPGWVTNARTKPVMVSIGAGYIRRGDVVIRDEATLLELRAFSRIRENKYAAAVGHDDRVMALLQGIAVIDHHFPSIMALKRKRESREKEKKSTGSRKRTGKRKRKHGVLGSEA